MQQGSLQECKDDPDKLISLPRGVEHNRPAHREFFSDHHSIWLSSNDRDNFRAGSRHVAKRRIHPLGCISLRMTVSEPRAPEADRPR